MRLPVTRSILLCGLLIVYCCLPSPAVGAPKPNILFIFADDMRADALSPYGNREINTPNLDRVASEGLVFERAYIMGAMQGAVCVPSRAMMMTGRSLFRVSERMQQQITWPEHLGSHGYRTFATGKWHNQAPALLRSFQIARAVFMGGMTDPFALKMSDRLPGLNTLTNTRTATDHATDAFAGEAARFLKDQGTAPFVCYVAFTAPHDPRSAPKAWHDKANASKPSLPVNFLPQHPFDNGELRIRDEQLEKWPRTPEAIRQHWADYKAVIEHMDEGIGKILQALPRSVRRNTIIVFAGDNGLALGSHGLMGKQNLYEHSIRVPLIMSGPGVPKGKRTPAMCYLFDLFPTLCEMTASPVPAGVEGRSLVPVLKGRSTHRDAIFAAYRNVARSYDDGHFKIIHYPASGQVQLFNLQQDPGETNNLAGQEVMSPELKRLQERLAIAQRDFADTSP